MNAHAQSTAALFELVSQGAEYVEHHAAASKTCRAGPFSFTVISNSTPLCQRLTRCLLPGGDGKDLTIALLSGSQPPFALPPAWNLPHTDPRHAERLHLSADGTLTALYNPDFHLWMILDHTRRVALMWISDEAQMPFWEEGAPFKVILNWFLASTNMFMVHGGIVGYGRQGCVLLGPGGSGKSTIVAYSFERGLRVGGDDLAIIEECGTSWRGWGLYNALKLDPTSRIPIPSGLATAPSTPSGEKKLMRYTDVDPGRFAIETSLTSLVQCVVANRKCSAITPASPAAILRALGPPTVFLLRGHEHRTISRIGRLVRSLPCYRFELGPDPGEAAAVLEAWLSQPEGEQR